VVMGLVIPPLAGVDQVAAVLLVAVRTWVADGVPLTVTPSMVVVVGVWFSHLPAPRL
jgi:hypothetical protein